MFCLGSEVDVLDKVWVMEKAEFSVGFLYLLGRLGEWGEKM
jgi:hypothetical protein